ncbi:hypothetical protein NBRGN_029_00320 [Nocardia brasiliensis NBRC 14402]|nr:hypothetical protein NBRGN_029_00320 [Nocardia brasiliensis NBRC 14402]
MLGDVVDVVVARAELVVGFFGPFEGGVIVAWPDRAAGMGKTIGCGIVWRGVRGRGAIGRIGIVTVPPVRTH